MTPRAVRARADAFAAVLAAAALVLAAARPARAGSEEFSTFSVEAQEEDDESTIDHLLARPPREWAREWERAPLAVRTSQACLTSGQWLDQTELKLRAPLGRSAFFGLDLAQERDDQVDYQYLDFSFHFPTRLGTAVGMFRPFHDKSRQDFAFMWDVGSDTSAFQLRLVAGLEDMFNNLWAFRQSRVGGVSEPYLRHPYEPGLRMVVRRPWLRAEVGGRYLTPGTKRLSALGNRGVTSLAKLWGTLAWASVETRALGLDWEVRSTNHQAASSEAPTAQPKPDNRDFRRQWTIETAASRRLTPRFTAELRWLYQERTQIHAPPFGPRTFAGVDRVLQAEGRWRPNQRLAMRLGAMVDRITITQTGAPSPVVLPTYGTRKESRAYLGLIARFGRVSVQGVEGFELDHEPYEVTLWHDKGFLQLQSTF